MSVRWRATSADPDNFGSLFAELGNAVGEPRDFPAGGVAVDCATESYRHLSFPTKSFIYMHSSERGSLDNPRNG
jgi:hypothetical protein